MWILSVYNSAWHVILLIDTCQLKDWRQSSETLYTLSATLQPCREWHQNMNLAFKSGRGWRRLGGDLELGNSSYSLGPREGLSGGGLLLGEAGSNVVMEFGPLLQAGNCCMVWSKSGLIWKPQCLPQGSKGMEW